VQIHEQSGKQLEKPNSYNEMIGLSSRLSKVMAHIRVDFYEINNKPYFGELTFYHHGGSIPFKSKKWDDIIGSWLKLPI
jgi:hypothetical protein